MRKLINGRSIDLGVCYYPEHWDRKLWAQDLDRMLAAGLKTVRIAEFAWSLIEPREGEYDYAFFDDFLNLAQEKGMQVIFCTPTATPPAWLTEKYPEALNADMDGHLIYHGSRRHYNYNAPKYQELCRNIVEKSAAHYGKHPAIVGWQLDNEFNCENGEFYSESDTAAFRRFLKEKYGTLEELNRAWGTVFWNQTYTDWREVHLPRRTNTNSPNPHLKLDYYRFISDSVCRFAQMQADILRKYLKPGDFVTTNGMFGNIDYQRMERESLDVLMYDSYPNFGYGLDGYNAGDPMKDRWWSRNLAEVRAVSPNFGIMEQQSGANGWNTRMEAPSPRPGQITLWTMQSIGHGADYISYFRWRTATFGTEIYWHGILDYSGRENRRLREVGQIYEKIKMMQELAGSKYEAKVGILKDYNNVWDAQLDRWHGRVESVSQNALFTAMQLAHVPFDYVYMEGLAGPESLKQYDLLFYPHASILTRERTAILEEYVAAGGKLVMGCRTGYKDENGQCVMEHLPGLAARLVGTDIPEYSFVAPDEGRVMADWDGTKIEAAVFNDLLAPLQEKPAGEEEASRDMQRPDGRAGNALAWDHEAAGPAAEMAERAAERDKRTAEMAERAVERDKRTAERAEKAGEESGSTAEVLAVYADSYYAGTPALIRNRFGRGEAYYFGGAFAPDTARVFLEKLGAAEPYGDVIGLPQSCELAVRGKEGVRWFFVLNFQPQPARIELKIQMRELWTGRSAQGVQELEGYGVGLYRTEEQ